MRRQTPLRPGRPPHRTTAIRTQNRKRKAANIERAHGPAERREWIKTLPCANCGIVGYSEGAHIKNGGMSRKADASQTIPLCGWHPVSWTANGSCHASQHAYGWDAVPALNTITKREAAAARCEAAWQQSCELRGTACVTQ